MKKLYLSAAFSLLFSALVHGQTNAPAASGNSAPPIDATIDFAATSAAHVKLFDSSTTAICSASPQPFTDASTTFLPISLNVSLPSAPSPAPPPGPNSYDTLRWQIALGVAWERFRSNIFNASSVGLNTTATYFLNDWFGVDGNVAVTFAPTIFQNEHIKLVNFGVGPRIAWRERRFEPFAHVLFGFSHELPQTAASSTTSYLIQAGGGTDYRMWSVLSLRAEADYLRNGFFGRSQNNFFLSAGFVFNF